MLRLRLFSAAFITAALVVASCDGSGEDDTPGESTREAARADSAAVGQPRGATPPSASPAYAVQAGAASDSPR